MRCPVTSGRSAGSLRATGRRPALREVERRPVGERADRVAYAKLAVAQLRNRALDVGRHQHVMHEPRVLVDVAQCVAGGDPISGPNACAKRPALATIEHRGARTRRDEVAVREDELGQRPADAVQDRAEQARPELGDERRTGRDDGCTDLEPGRVLEQLERRGVAGEANHLAEQATRTDADELVEAGVA
jgi:hypothetical protein